MWKVLLLSASLSGVLALSPLQSQVHLPSSAAKPIPHNIPALGIINGNEATPGQFPHQVGIWIYGPNNTKSFCGGSILTPYIVITAAQCAEAGSWFDIKFGVHNIKKDLMPEYRTTTVKLVHADYKNDGKASNDIALLHWTVPLVWSSAIQPIRLPERSNFWNAEVTASGWGHLHSDDLAVAETLHFVKSRVVSNLYCQARYFFKHVRSTNICISGWWAKGTCQGDTGGPLVVYEADGKPTLVGITSYGVSYCSPLSWPSVFTRVSSYLDWIEAGRKQLRG